MDESESYLEEFKAEIDAALQDALAVIDAVRKIPMPRSVGEAIETGWRGIVEAPLALPLSEYGEEEKRLDDNRVIRLSEAVLALRNFQGEMEELASPDIAEPFKERLAEGVQGLVGEEVSWVQIIADLLSEDPDDKGRGLVRWFGRRFVKLFNRMMAFVDVSAVIATGKKVEAAKLRCVARMRRRALPQREGERYRRRKTTRL